jgi:hypothetical protein
VYAYEALIGASMNEDWPLILATINADRSAKSHGKTEKEFGDLTRFISSIDLASIAFRFVYLHEFFHALLGHTKFLSETFGPAAFATHPAALSLGELEETRKTRAAFELEADACASKTLLYELLSGQFDDFFTSRGIGVIAIGFAMELMYILNLELTESLSLMEWEAVFRLEDAGVYTNPIKRRFYLLTKIFESCREETLARGFEDCIEYGASVARKCYQRVAVQKLSAIAANEPQDDDKKHERHILQLSHMMKTGQAMVDPSEWARHHDTLLRRVRSELSMTNVPPPYCISFVLEGNPLPLGQQQITNRN